MRKQKHHAQSKRVLCVTKGSLPSSALGSRVERSSIEMLTGRKRTGGQSCTVFCSRRCRGRRSRHQVSDDPCPPCYSPVIAANHCLDYDFKSYENLLSPNMAAAFRQLLDEDLPTRIARQLEDRLRLIPGAQSNFVQAQLPDMIRTCIQEALSNVPPQLLAGDEPTPLRESQLDPPAGTAKGPDSHGTAQIGSQFASIAPPQETPVPSEQDLPEVTLPSHSQLWVPIPDQLDLGAIFGEDYFPNPLAETADGLRESNNSQSFPTATAFTTIGFPSAMLAGTPVPSPSLLPDLSFDRFDFAGAGTLSFHGALGNMPNSAFLFTQEDKPSSNGNVAGHQLDQYTY
jgi:hypothetical protein